MIFRLRVGGLALIGLWGGVQGTSFQGFTGWGFRSGFRVYRDICFENGFRFNVLVCLGMSRSY